MSEQRCKCGEHRLAPGYAVNDGERFHTHYVCENLLVIVDKLCEAEAACERNAALFRQAQESRLELDRMFQAEFPEWETVIPPEGVPLRLHLLRALKARAEQAEAALRAAEQRGAERMREACIGACERTAERGPSMQSPDGRIYFGAGCGASIAAIRALPGTE